MKGCAGLWVWVLSAGLLWADEPAAQSVDAVKARLLAEALQGRADIKRAEDLAAAQSPDGRWPEIRYDATDRMLWPPMEHLDRLAVLARASRDAAPAGAGQAAVAQALVRGFDFWVARDPRSANWWYNEIGAVQSLYRTLLLAEPLLADGRLEKGCALLARSKLGMTGQNLVWLAENVIGRACLQRDPALMAEAFKRIEAEIVVTEKEGIQPDFSFHQHGAQLYSGGYGNGFAASAPRFALLAQGTAFAFAPEKIRILESYLLDGQQWMIRGRQFDYSASGREPTRPNSGKVGGYAVNARTLLKLDAVARREELERFAARIEKGLTPATPALAGHRHFWRADYTVHHTPAWMVSVRMTSTRLQQSEVVNEENLLGEHLSDGVMYLYRTGDEYRNVFPVWDWSRLPGITVEHDRPLRRINNRRRGSRSFAGGVSDGVCGVSAMAFERDGLTASKGWFFFGDEVVCLGAGIGSTNAFRVLTSVNQCLAEGPVTVRRAEGGPEVLAGPEKLVKPLWAHHAGVGYLFLDAGVSVGVGASVQTGSWRRVSMPQKPDPVSMPIFSLWVNHGTRPQGGSYAYVVTPRPDAAAVEAYAGDVPVRAVANTPSVQAVEQVREGVLQAAFYQAGQLASPTWGTVAVDAPCLLMLKKEGGDVAVSACNPENRGGRVTVRACGQELALAFPEGGSAGASVRATLKK